MTGEDQRAACAQALLSAHSPISDDQPGLLGERDELGRLDGAARGMRPAHQAFEARHLLRLEADDRLIEEIQLVPLEGLAQVDLELPAHLDVGVHLGLEERVAVPAVCLGAVEGKVGVLHELVGIGAVARRHGHADGGGDVDAVPVDLVVLADGLDDARGEHLAAVGVAHVGLDDGELVAAQARHEVALAHAAEQALADLLQQHVADGMAERVVDALKRSRSRQKTAKPWPRRSRSSACCSCSRNSARLARLVSASWRARCVISCSWRRRSVTSSCSDTQPPPFSDCRATAMMRSLPNSIVMASVHSDPGSPPSSIG